MVQVHVGAFGLGHRNALDDGALTDLLVHPAWFAARRRLGGRGAGLVGRRPGHTVTVRLGHPHPGCRKYQRAGRDADTIFTVRFIDPSNLRVTVGYSHRRGQ